MARDDRTSFARPLSPGTFMAMALLQSLLARRVAPRVARTTVLPCPCLLAAGYTIAVAVRPKPLASEYACQCPPGLVPAAQLPGTCPGRPAAVYSLIVIS